MVFVYEVQYHVNEFLIFFLVPFANMQKSSISEDKKIKNLVNKGLVEAMAGLRSISEGLLTSAEYCFRYEALNMWIPALSTGLRRIVSHDADPSRRFQIGSSFEISFVDEAPNQTHDYDIALENAISRKVSGIMMKNISYIKSI